MEFSAGTTLRCLEGLPLEGITVRAIAAESGANQASITYHFGSKDALVTAAINNGLDRWLEEVSQDLAALSTATPADRFRRAGQILTQTRRRHAGLIRHFVAVLARAPHDPRVRQQLAEGFHRTRPAVAELMNLGDDETGNDAAGWTTLSSDCCTAPCHQISHDRPSADRAGRDVIFDR
jgi:AcrR family transcriptional regulator